MTMVPTQASPATQVAHANAPISDLDPYSDEALMEPWAMYRELQGLGSAVWLTRYQMFALTRYDSVIRALKDASSFSSASGVMMNDNMNEVLRRKYAVQRWRGPSTLAPRHRKAARSNGAEIA